MLVGKVRIISRLAYRGYSNSTILQNLDQLTCITVTGEAGHDEQLIQGITTNDIRHLRAQGQDNKSQSQYTLMLNNRGRLITDCLLSTPKNTICIECHSSVSQTLIKHMSMYNIRKKVKIEKTDWSVWALFSESEFNNSLSSTNNDIFVYRDPRLDRLGYRILAPPACSGEELIGVLKIQCKISSNSEYERHRYKLGVAEGPRELLEGNSFPLECNGDYLHGISFQKGCYIGQELTARTYHTGVIRKRIMPLVFESAPGDIPIDTPIFSETDSKTSIGKFRGCFENVGVGLLRIAPALAASSLLINGHRAKTFKPTWWPIEAPKEVPETVKTETS